MPRRKRARVEKVVVITGDQRTDIDVRAIARVLIRLARQWAEGQQQADDTPDAYEDAGKDES